MLSICYGDFSGWFGTSNKIIQERSKKDMRKKLQQKIREKKEKNQDKCDELLMKS